MSYSDSNHPFDFNPEPEPEPPKGNESSNSYKQSHSSDGRPSGDSSTSEGEERTWTSLTLPGAILNSTIYVLGKTIEFLAPYWPNSEQRHKVQAWANGHPVLTSFMIMQAMFILVPVFGFALFVVALAVVVIGGAVLFVVGTGLGVGVMVFIPGVLAAVGWAAVVWAWAYVGFRAASGAWVLYKSSPYYQQLSQVDSKKTGNDRNQQRKAEEKPRQRENGVGYKHGGNLSLEEKRPTSASSLASSTVKVEPGYAHAEVDGRPYADVLKDGERDEDKVGRDIMRSLG